MNLSAIIVDDELPGRENLVAIISSYFNNIEIVDQANSIDSAYIKINEKKPDFIFLDMELGYGTGFDLIDMFENPGFEVIFVTAYHDYAAKAFRTIASDYLLKPIDVEDLRKAIEKVTERIDYKRIKENQGFDQAPGADFIKLTGSDGQEMIPVDEIVYLQSLNYYTSVVLKNKRKILTTRHLKDYEEMLRKYDFYRIHNSYIINIKHLKGVTTKNELSAWMVDDIKISISRRRKDEFYKFIESKDKNVTEF
ncbi:MAG: response regulator transcription factor [Saprospiraceae bacterium]|nr:response regulator transcription factor [Saprospiraceae bacterium]